MPSIAEILQTSAEILHRSEIKESRREAVSLLALALQKDKTFLIAHDDYQLSAEEEKRFQEFLTRRANREPLQYIRGTQEFFGLNFIVTPDVLIPRPETELIVESAIEILREETNPRFCEIGVGSGCISISILHEIENASAIGLDISENALKIAETNARQNKTADRLKLKTSDVFENLRDEKFDLIVSNPPYIDLMHIETLQPEVRDFEPHTALTDGADGFSIIEKIIVGAPQFLRGGGYILLEIGFDQSARVSEIFDQSVWQPPEFLKDLQGIARTVKARLNFR